MVSPEVMGCARIEDLQHRQQLSNEIILTEPAQHESHRNAPNIL